MYTMSGRLGFDYGDLWSTVKNTTVDIVKALPGATQAAVEKTVTEKVTPLAQKAVQAKTENVLKKGNVAMMLLGGAALGALVAGGGWQRRTVGGLVVGAAATAVGWKIGWLEDRG
jgi:hypothetical protein